MKKEASELAWRTKVTIGLAFVGAWAGAWAWAWWLAEESGGSAGWGMVEWIRWPFALVGKGFGGELLAAAAAGAVLLAGPVLWLMLRKRSARPTPGARRPLNPL
ncbi:MAG: hypothetical protein M0Z99_13285 [Betaproteobacteria bacterium]|nr:hypothetical protein [Betaproteobacteria bacterium]